MFSIHLSLRRLAVAHALWGAVCLAGDSAAQSTTVAAPQPRPTSDASAYTSANASSSIDLVRRALTRNLTLAAAQLEVARAEARLRQAALLPNPSLDFEQVTGRFTGAPNEGETTTGIAVPLELGGKRARRIDVARAELDAARAQFRERQRQIIGEVLGSYADALASLRELQMTERLNALDVETAKFVEARVREGDAPPLELELLRVEMDRLVSRRQLLDGRVQAALIRLRTLTGGDTIQDVRIREDLSAAALPGEVPTAIDSVIAAALDRRPDVQLARANERAASANIGLARALAVPDVTPFARYSIERSAFDETPVGPLRDRSKSFGFGVSLTLPFFNRNQGLRAEASAALEQARREREFTETAARADIEGASLRYRAAEEARKTFESGVIDRSTRNIQTIRTAYQLGEFRITDLIAEQRRLVDSQRDYTDLLAERYRALVELQIALGNLNPENR